MNIISDTMLVAWRGYELKDGETFIANMVVLLSTDDVGTTVYCLCQGWMIKDATNIVPGEGEREGMENNPSVNIYGVTQIYSSQYKIL